MDMWILALVGALVSANLVLFVVCFIATLAALTAREMLFTPNFASLPMPLLRSSITNSSCHNCLIARATLSPTLLRHAGTASARMFLYSVAQRNKHGFLHADLRLQCNARTTEETYTVKTRNPPIQETTSGRKTCKIGPEEKNISVADGDHKVNGFDVKQCSQESRSTERPHRRQDTQQSLSILHTETRVVVRPALLWTWLLGQDRATAVYVARDVPVQIPCTSGAIVVLELSGERNREDGLGGIEIVHMTLQIWVRRRHMAVLRVWNEYGAMALGWRAMVVHFFVLAIFAMVSATVVIIGSIANRFATTARIM